MYIHWCEDCNHAPAEGVLTVIRKGETQPTNMLVCQKCVDKLQPEDWIENNDLQGRP